jgi:putative DNA primase/helicase
MNPVTLDTIRAALDCVPPDLTRDEWAQVAMALKSELGDSGFDLFDAWSARGEKYQASEAKSTWRSVKAGGPVTIGSLFHLAKSHGFKFDEDPKPAKRATPAELAAQAKARREAAQTEREQARAKHEAAASQALKLWDQAKDEGRAPYLVRKGIKGHGVRYAKGGVLLVPMRDAEGRLWNVQACYPERLKDRKTGEPGTDKLYRAGEGGRKSGLWHMLGSVQTPLHPGALVLLIAEGYATGASLHEATGHPVAVAFDAGNLLHVAKEQRRLCPGALIVVCADDDRPTEAKTGKNPGKAGAMRAAEQVGGVMALPDALPEGGKDFNDMHAHAGLDAVRSCVEAVIAQALNVAPTLPPRCPRDPQSQAPEQAARGLDTTATALTMVGFGMTHPATKAAGHGVCVRPCTSPRWPEMHKTTERLCCWSSTPHFARGGGGSCRYPCWQAMARPTVPNCSTMVS